MLQTNQEQFFFSAERYQLTMPALPDTLFFHGRTIFWYTGCMKSLWRIQDIIDLEYFLQQDKERTSPEDLQKIRERDRHIYQEIIASGGGGQETPDRNFLLGLWLQARREEDGPGGNNLLPGRLTTEIYGKLRTLFPALGILTGLAAGLSFFTYTGTAPLNVFHYLAAFVLLQLAFLGLLACSLIYRAKKPSRPPALLTSLVTGLMIRLYQAAGRRLLARMSADKRNSFQTTLGILKGKRHYAPLLFWPVILLTQLFAIGFNTGLLAITLFKVTSTDIAFGWQSTIQFSAEAIFHFVRVLALPWSWCVSSALAYPSLPEIEGSRIILKDGIYHLTTLNLISWWPFLCFALLGYGLLPRIVLLLLAFYRQRKALAELQLDQAMFDRLLVRMQTPLVSSQAAPEETHGRNLTESGQMVEEADYTARTEAMVFVPDDIFDHCPDAELNRVLAEGGNFLVKKIKFAEDYASDQDILADFAASDGVDGQTILILMEAWMPPITDFIAFLDKLRQALARDTIIRIGLIGRPVQKTIFTPVEPGDLKVWQRKIDSLGDPYLSVENLAP
jgi:hypothetical protein